MRSSADSAVNLADIADPGADADRDAIIFTLDGRRRQSVLSYADMNRQIGRIAAGLGARGLAVGDRVAILSANRPEHILVQMGAMRAGMVAVPLNQKLLQRGVRHILDDADVRLTFCDAANEALLRDRDERLSFDATGPGGFAAFLPGEPLPTRAAAADTIAMIMYTSGSTGRPKGVPITHGGYLWAMRQFEFLRPVIERQRVLLAAPLFHMNAQFHILAALQCGGTAVVMPGFDAAAYLRAIDNFGVARVTGVPTMFVLLLREFAHCPDIDLGSVRSVAMGSAPVSDKLLRELGDAFPGAVISNGYGTTEAGPAVFGPHAAGLATPPGSIGTPMPGVEVRLAGGGDSDEGELWVRNPMLTRGYLNQPEATAERFVDGWYATGDRMRRDGDGFYFFVDRSDDMMVCGGENVYPADVEKRLELHADIRQAAVVAIPDEIKGELPVAFVVTGDAATVTEDDVRRHALDNGPAYAHPRYVAFVDSLPLSGVNKIDRKALAREALSLFGNRRSAKQS